MEPQFEPSECGPLATAFRSLCSTGFDQEALPLEVQASGWGQHEAPKRKGSRCLSAQGSLDLDGFAGPEPGVAGYSLRRSKKR